MARPGFRYSIGAAVGGGCGLVATAIWDRVFKGQQAALRWEMLIIGVGVGVMLGLLAAAATLSPAASEDD